MTPKVLAADVRIPMNIQELDMAVTARFCVAEVTQQAYGGYAEPAPVGSVKMRPSTRGDENKAWASATPAGLIEMTITNSPAWEFFKENIGRDIAITFDLPADPEA